MLNVKMNIVNSLSQKMVITYDDAIDPILDVLSQKPKNKIFDQTFKLLHSDFLLRQYWLYRVDEA